MYHPWTREWGHRFAVNYAHLQPVGNIIPFSNEHLLPMKPVRCWGIFPPRLPPGWGVPSLSCAQQQHGGGRTSPTAPGPSGPPRRAPCRGAQKGEPSPLGPPSLAQSGAAPRGNSSPVDAVPWQGHVAVSCGGTCSPGRLHWEHHREKSRQLSQSFNGNILFLTAKLQCARSCVRVAEFCAAIAGFQDVTVSVGMGLTFLPAAGGVPSFGFGMGTVGQRTGGFGCC